MGRGFSGVRAASQDIEDRKNSGGSGGKLYFKLADNETAVVRFLEQGDDVVWAWVHELPPESGRLVGDKIPCRAYDDEGMFTGDDCPGCEKQYKRTFQGAINVIWNDAPVFQRDADNKLIKENGKVVVVGHEDQVAVWVAGITVFDDLLENEETYKGLSSRPFRIKRKGTGFNTKYDIKPANPDDGAIPFSAAETALAAEKYDLTSYSAKPSYETWGKKQQPSRNKDTVVPSDTSPFMRNRRE